MRSNRHTQRLPRLGSPSNSNSNSRSTAGQHGAHTLPSSSSTRWMRSRLHRLRLTSTQTQPRRWSVVCRWVPELAGSARRRAYHAPICIWLLKLNSAATRSGSCLTCRVSLCRSQRACMGNMVDTAFLLPQLGSHARTALLRRYLRLQPTHMESHICNAVLLPLSASEVLDAADRLQISGCTVHGPRCRSSVCDGTAQR